jgi:glucokinase
MSETQVAVGIDIGGTNTKIGIFDSLGTLLSFKNIPTARSILPEEFIKLLSQEVDSMLSKDLGVNFKNPTILGVGAGAPMANTFTGFVEHAPNLGWKNVALQALLSQFFHCPVLIENDANLAAVGEKKWGNGKDLCDFVLVTLGTGVGTGLILDNKIYRGHRGQGAEGGHVIIPHEKKRLCTCGGLNHLESYLSAKGIKQTIFELTGQRLTIERLGELFHQGDQPAIDVIEQVASELARGLASMAALLGPEAFIIGGGVAKLGEAFNQVVKRKMEEFIHFSLKDKIKILPAALSSEKGAIFGGAAYILDRPLP